MHPNSYTVTSVRSLQNQMKNAKLRFELNSSVSKSQISFISLFIFHLRSYQARAKGKTKTKIPKRRQFI